MIVGLGTFMDVDDSGTGVIRMLQHRREQQLRLSSFWAEQQLLGEVRFGGSKCCLKVTAAHRRQLRFVGMRTASA